MIITSHLMIMHTFFFTWITNKQIKVIVRNDYHWNILLKVYIEIMINITGRIVQVSWPETLLPTCIMRVCVLWVYLCACLCALRVCLCVRVSVYWGIVCVCVCVYLCGLRVCLFLCTEGVSMYVSLCRVCVCVCVCVSLCTEDVCGCVSVSLHLYFWVALCILECIFMFFSRRKEYGIELCNEEITLCLVINLEQ